MSENLIFTNTKLTISGKSGILKPDSEGYYTLPIGAFNCENSMGEVYTKDNVDELFSSSGALMRKVNSGKLYGEWGHPKQNFGESDNDYMARASSVNDKETCVFFHKLWNESNVGHDFAHCRGINPQSVITFGRLKPMGLKWETLQRALDDPNCNIAFSVRNMGKDRIYRGKTYVSVVEILTYDAVGEQGVGCAEKHASLHLESHRVVVTRKMVETMRHNLQRGALRQESVANVTAMIASADRHFRAMDNPKPAYADWS